MDHRSNREEAASHGERGMENAPAAPPRGPEQPEAAAGENGNEDHHLNIRDAALEEGGVIEAGVAVAVHQAHDPRQSTECDLIFLFQCHENLQNQSNSIAKHGTTISIGLDKNTKLNAVFAHFARFCSKSGNGEEVISESELEFVHNEVLNGNDTAEASALMKNDVIKVRKLRIKEKQMEIEKKKIQNQIDFYYFKDFQILMEDRATCNVVFDCGGRLKLNSGKGIVRGHSVLLSKRCSWLKQKILDSKNKKNFFAMKIPNEILVTENSKSESEQREIPYFGKNTNFVSSIEENKVQGLKRRQVSHIVETSRNNRDSKFSEDLCQKTVKRLKTCDGENTHNLSVSKEIEADDSDESVQPFPLDEKQIEPGVDCGVAKVVAEEGDLPQHDKKLKFDEMSSRTIPSSVVRNSKSILVELHDHPIQAVQLLLEYCYTNRCTCLGEDAFHQLSRGAVANPYTYRWPNQGLPTISINTALAGISLAEEAGLPRLSLMCEIAASHLLTKGNILDALCLCSRQTSLSGNSLSVLRKSAMLHFLQETKLEKLAPGSEFRFAFERKSHLVIPSVLKGTEEVLGANAGKYRKKINRYWMFPRHDEEDRSARNKERRKCHDKRKNQRAHKICPFKTRCIFHADSNPSC